MMTVDINCAEVSNSGYLFQYVIKNLLKLKTEYNWLNGSKVIFKNVDDPEGNSKVCEIELNIPGAGIFASAKNSDFRLAAKETINILSKHLKNRNKN